MVSAAVDFILCTAAIPRLNRPRNSTTPAIHTAGNQGTVWSRASFNRTRSGTETVSRPSSATAVRSRTKVANSFARWAANSDWASRAKVARGSATISTSAAQATAYRTRQKRAAIRPSTHHKAAATAIPCQQKCSNVHPSARSSGSATSDSGTPNR